MNFYDRYSEYKSAFEEVLSGFCNKLTCEPRILYESMVYSLNIGGKRLRPVLMLAVGDMLGVERKKIYNFALALELIHTYSLIHDDLPEMDNDDFRRGQPSNHKKFGHGNAVLAGDALLNTAYSVLLDECANGGEYVSAAKFICDCAGAKGMIAGQSADLLHEGDDCVDENTLGFIYENKTAKLILAAVVVPSILKSGRYFSELNVFGRDLGYLFQLTDDILDVEGSFDSLGKSTGKDGKAGKYTAVKLYGLDGSKLRADILADNCCRLLEGINGDTEFLKELSGFVRQRIY